MPHCAVPGQWALLACGSFVANLDEAANHAQTGMLHACAPLVALALAPQARWPLSQGQAVSMFMGGAGVCLTLAGLPPGRDGELPPLKLYGPWVRL